MDLKVLRDFFGILKRKRGAYFNSSPLLHAGFVFVVVTVKLLKVMVVNFCFS